MIEQWKPVVGFEGEYEVSDLGRVRSFKRKSMPGKILRHGWKGAGYTTVTLSSAGRCTSVKVHHLVLTAFVGPRPAGLEGCHNDSDKTNNTVSNLRWDTHLSNISDRPSKLNAAKVLQIRSDARSDEKVAASLGVSSRTVYSVRRGETWAHVQGGAA